MADQKNFLKKFLGFSKEPSAKPGEFQSFENKKLNVDFSDSVVRFESLMEKILPKRIFYKLLLRGKGLEFDSYRNFNPDDDSSSIDWKASKRANSLLVRQYVEERDVKIMFLIDISNNMIFGSMDKLKCEYAAEIVAALGYVITNYSTDQLGYIFFNDHIVQETPLRPGKKQFETLVYEISNPNFYGGNSDIYSVLDRVIEIIDPSITILFIISDFLSVDEKCKDEFENIGAKIETVAIMIRDPLDRTFPELNKEVIIEDPKTHERLLVNPKLAKEMYEQNAKYQEEMVKKIFQNSNIDCLNLGTEEDFAPKLALFLKNRAERRD